MEARQNVSRRIIKRILFETRSGFPIPSLEGQGFRSLVEARNAWWKLLARETKMAGVLFEDIFDVKDIDPEGKKFDRGNVFNALVLRCIMIEFDTN